MKGLVPPRNHNLSQRILRRTTHRNPSLGTLAAKILAEEERDSAAGEAKVVWLAGGEDLHLSKARVVSVAGEEHLLSEAKVVWVAGGEELHPSEAKEVWVAGEEHLHLNKFREDEELPREAVEEMTFPGPHPLVLATKEKANRQTSRLMDIKICLEAPLHVVAGATEAEEDAGAALETGDIPESISAGAGVFHEMMESRERTQ
jgi:hypothetical protein